MHYNYECCYLQNLFHRYARWQYEITVKIIIYVTVPHRGWHRYTRELAGSHTRLVIYPPSQFATEGL